MVTRKLEKEDLQKLVGLHYEVLPNQFLTSISKSFLLGFYKNIFSSNYSRFIGVFEKQELLGAIVGVEEEYKPKYIPYIRLLLTNSFFLLKSPKTLISLFQSFIFKLKEKQETEIFFIGVKKAYQGKGIGKTLVNTLEKELGPRNKELFVDCKCKLPSNNFYQSLGFKRKKTFKLYNEDWNHYEKSI
jgi:ribosomal protein S18 acetylase RimI-like enzyme